MDSNAKEKVKKYLDDLKILWRLEKGKIDDFKKEVKLKNSKEYLEGLPHTKPEAILSDKLMRPLLDMIGLKSFREMHPPGGESGWVDYIIAGARNPVALELKPLHGHNGEKKSLERIYNSMKTQPPRRNQIIKYLRGTDSSIGGVDYVILTNMEDVYYFSRDAIKKFEPFYKEKFDKFVEGLIEIDDIWEYVRRKEDSTPKRELDEQFLKDLRVWANELSNLHWTIDNPYEIIIHLLNKLVFIRTLEDFGLVPFRFIQEKFKKYEEEWGPKGVKIMLQRFFDEIDTWFYWYYDTELFRKKALDYLADDEENLEKFKETIQKVLGFTFLGDIFFQGMMSYNFRHIDEDVFGKSYETYLAERRKESGIYYTPKEITNYMAKTLVKEIFGPVKEELLRLLNSGEYVKNFEYTKELVKKLTRIAIVDPACGSGSFLIKVLREIYKIYIELNKSTDWITDVWKKSTLEELPPDIQDRVNKTREIREMLGFKDGESHRHLITLIILRHIHGVDLDERAIETAKGNMWKEAVKLEPGDFRYTKLPKDKNHILPDLETNFVVGDSLASIPEKDVVKIISEKFKDEIKQLWEIRNEYLKNPFEPEVLEKIKPIKEKIREHLKDKMRDIGWNFDKTLFYPLEFFFLYFDENGEPLPEAESGFHGVIGNPPWETVEPSEKEFAALHEDLFKDVFPRGVTKFSIPGKEFKKKFYKKLNESKEIKELWNQYYTRIKRLSEFVHHRYKFSTEGKVTLQKVFLERAMELSKGAVNLLIPSNFHTDEGAMPLRKEIFENHCLKELISFENRGNGWFKDVDSRFKFDTVFFTKEMCGSPFRAAFYVTRRDYKEWAGNNDGAFEDFINEVTFNYPVELILKLSPGVLGITEFRRKEDVVLIQKIRGDWKFLRDHGWDMFQGDFNMTKDNDLFNTSPAGLPLQEGKMIHQYEPFFSEPRYWVEEERSRERLLSKELSRVKRFLKDEGKRLGLKGRELKDFINENYKLAEESFKNSTFKLDYEEYRLVYRRIASSTNERTLISAIIPKKVFASESIPYFKPFRYTIKDGRIVQERIPHEDVVYLMALLNSFTLDYFIRQRVSANLNMFYIYELPIPEIEPELKEKIVEMAFRLLYRNGHYNDMAKELGVDTNEIVDEDERRDLRAELEVAIARDVFGLTKEEMVHILGTFVYGNVDRELIKQILEKYDEL